MDTDKAMTVYDPRIAGSKREGTTRVYQYLHIDFLFTFFGSLKCCFDV
jgi:hypothetical protein